MISNVFAPRLIAATPVALFITVAIGALMQALISQDGPTVYYDPVPAPDRHFAPIAPSTEQPKPSPIEKPEWVEPRVTAIGPVVRIVRPDAADVADDDGWTQPFRPSLPTLDSQETAFVTQAPQLLFTPIVEYPQAMYPREGSCDVLFDVAASGGTSNIRVASCTDRGFSRAAEHTVARAVYRPAQGEAGPVASVGHRATIEFKIEE